MAAKKKTDTVSEVRPVKEAVFSKSNILMMKRYAARRDLLSVLLEDGKTYTKDQVDTLIDHFMKGKVK